MRVCPSCWEVIARCVKNRGRWHDVSCIATDSRLFWSLSRFFSAQLERRVAVRRTRTGRFSRGRWSVHLPTFFHLAELVRLRADVRYPAEFHRSARIGTVPAALLCLTRRFQRPARFSGREVDVRELSSTNNAAALYLDGNCFPMKGTAEREIKFNAL